MRISSRCSTTPKRAGRKLLNRETGHFLAHHKPTKVTYWVEYIPSESEYIIHNAYVTGWKLRRTEDGGRATRPIQAIPPGGAANATWAWKRGRWNISYLGSMFPVDLRRCPKCGQVFIPEELVLGKMSEVEKLLEDK